MHKILKSWICGQMCWFFTCMSIFFPPFRRLEHEIRRPTQDRVMSDTILSVKLKKKSPFIWKISEQGQSATVSARVLPHTGRSYKSRGAVLLVGGGGGGASVTCRAPLSLFSVVRTGVWLQSWDSHRGHLALGQRGWWARLKSSLQWESCPHTIDKKK